MASQEGANGTHLFHHNVISRLLVFYVAVGYHGCLVGGGVDYLSGNDGVGEKVNGFGQCVVHCSDVLQSNRPCFNQCRY